MKGQIHIYCGKGKGKTTAAAGLALRCAGAGKKVVFSQFYKDGSSSEVRAMACLPQIRVVVSEKPHGFFFCMTPEEKEEAAQDYTRVFEKAAREAQDADLLVLDEILSACRNNTVPEEQVLRFLRERPAQLEVVLTGRDPSGEFLALGDYITEMKAIRHPYEKGLKARLGIEY